MKLIRYGITILILLSLVALAPKNLNENTTPEVSLLKTELTQANAIGDSLYHNKTCFICHGEDGKTPLDPIYPTIAGQNINYILQQMRDIKSGARDNNQTAAMHGIMQLVSDEELEILAQYVSELPRGEATGPPPERRSDGSRLFRRKTCFTCHGRDGKTPIMPEYPKITGQSPEYVKQQIHDIKSGERSNGMTMAMKSVMFLVTDEEIDIISDYISKLAP